MTTACETHPNPRPADHLRGVLASRLAATVCSHLPVGFWQRRLAARAFGLSVVPPVDRHRPQQATTWTVTGVDPIFVIETPLALWALLPGAEQDPVAVLQRLHLLGPHQFTALLAVRPSGHVERLLPRRRRRPAVVTSEALQIGAVHWSDLRDIFDEAAQVLREPAQRDLAARAARTLRSLEDAQIPEVEDLRA
jgi:hypothetical protein